MRRITKILHVERRKKDKKPYTIVHLLLEDGMEARYYGDDVTLGDYVLTFYDQKWDMVKAVKPKKTS